MTRLSHTDPIIRRQHHGRWIDPQGSPGASHPEYCNMTGAHLIMRCGVRHATLTNDECPVVRLWCPERGGSLWVGL